MKKILVVCTGNICRSAMAEVVLNHVAEQDRLPIEVDSAGISDEEEGNPIDPRARRVLEENGFEVPPHRAHQVRAGELAQYDLVLAMTRHHQAALRRIAARDQVDTELHPIKLWRDYESPDSHSSDRDVPDPWYGGYQDFVDTLTVVESCVPNILKAVL